MTKHFVAPALLTFSLIAVVYANRPADRAGKDFDPASARIDYRPGGYMPPGFPTQGAVKLLTAPVVEAGKRSQVRIEYTIGEAGAATGEALEIWKHFTSDVEEFQIDDPNGAAYFDLETSAPGVKFERIIYTNAVQRNRVGVFPYRKALGAKLTAGSLKQGDKVYFDLGGTHGVRMQHYAENLFNFRVLIVGADELPRDYGGDAFMKVTGGRATKLRVNAPTFVGVRESFSVEVVVSDDWQSLARDYQGHEFSFVDAKMGTSEFEYDPTLLHYVANNVIANDEGVYRLEVRNTDGSLRGVSNPIRVEQQPKRRVYYGDLHQHTYLHDGRGVFEELYVHARRTGLLDFGALTPHHMPLAVTGPSYHFDKFKDPRDNWPDMIRANKLLNGWKDFVTILAYEYSVNTAAGGHHNVFFRGDTAKTTMQLEPNTNRANVGVMMDVLQRAQTPAMVIPHVGGGPPNWNHKSNPRIERGFEIASVHGVFEESWQAHLKAGVRLSATASSDNHTVGFGNSYPGLIYTMTNPLTGVYAYGKSRDDIWDGLYERMTFGVTGNQRILMDFHVNDEPMGGEIPSSHFKTAKVHAHVSGTEPLTRIDLMKNSEVVHSVYPSRNRGSLLRIQWGDNIYQRRANTAIGDGKLSAGSSTLRLRRDLHRDQQFETMQQAGRNITWRTAATSNDRDGMLVDISGVSGALKFELEDPDLGTIAIDIPIDQLKQAGYFRWQGAGTKPREHSYLKMMGIDVSFVLEAELVNGEGPMDFDFDYEDRAQPKPGDYYYLRMEQLDTNKGWASPVWVN